MNIHDLSTAQSLASHYCNYRPDSALKPLNFSTPSHFHRCRKRHTLDQAIDNGETLQPPQRGIIFEWPQRRRLYSEKELCFGGWIIAHALYWLHILHILPSGAAINLKQPPWRYKPPLPKPENRDYIIEPDWDSIYK